MFCTAAHTLSLQTPEVCTHLYTPAHSSTHLYTPAHTCTASSTHGTNHFVQNAHPFHLVLRDKRSAVREIMRSRREQENTVCVCVCVRVRVCVCVRALGIEAAVSNNIKEIPGPWSWSSYIWHIQMCVALCCTCAARDDNNWVSPRHGKKRKTKTPFFRIDKLSLSYSSPIRRRVKRFHPHQLQWGILGWILWTSRDPRTYWSGNYNHYHAKDV